MGRDFQMLSSSNGINHSALKLLIEAGAITTVTAFAKADQWTLKITFGDSVKIVLAFLNTELSLFFYHT